MEWAQLATHFRCDSVYDLHKTAIYTSESIVYVVIYRDDEEKNI